MHHRALLTLALLGTLTACKKEASPDRERLLKAHSWTLTAAEREVTPAGGPPVITDALFPSPCTADNYFVFLDQGRLEGNEGAVWCTNSRQITYGTWYLDHKQETLIASMSGAFALSEQSLLDKKIEELSNTTLKLSSSRTSGPGQTEVYRYTYQAR